MKENRNILYLAGIIDGEGTIGISKQKERQYHLYIQVGNTSEPLMKYLKDNYGGKYCGQSKKENRMNSFIWYDNCRKAVNIIKQIQPYLVIKTQQADLAIRAYEDTFRIDYNNRGTHQVPQFAVDKREYYYQEMKKLNQVGKKRQEEEPMNIKSKCIIILNNNEVGRNPITEREVAMEEENNNNENNKSLLSYFAAIVDGEGTIGIKRSKRRYHISLYVKNTSKELMDYLKDNYAGTVYGPYESKEENWKDKFLWECSGKEAIKLIKQIEPYLVIKQEQAELAIAAWKDIFKNNYHNGADRIPKYAIDKREEYYQEMKKLNKRGKYEENGEEIEITLKINRNTLERWLKESN